MSHKQQHCNQRLRLFPSPFLRHTHLVTMLHVTVFVATALAFIGAQAAAPFGTIKNLVSFGDSYTGKHVHLTNTMPTKTDVWFR
jgi:hypothetical protein